VSALRCRQPRKNSGFSLLEVLVASAVFSLGLAGLAALLLSSINSSADARREGYAAVAAASLAELIRLNPVALNRYLNPAETISRICMTGDICSPEQQADFDFRLWQIELADAIKNARGLVCRDSTPTDGAVGSTQCDGAGPLTIKIFWSGPGNTNQHRFTLQVS